MSSMTDNDYFYGSWRKMHTRCYDESYHSFHRYGGRGIIVTPAWHNYKVFKSDLFATWYRGATLDRIDNDGNYEHGNVRWLSKAENTKPQMYNLEAILRMRGEGLRQRDIAELIGSDQAYVSRLLKRGESRGL